MPEEKEGVSDREDTVRVLQTREFLQHYAHVQSGRRRSKGCGFCGKGLKGVLAEYANPLSAPGLLQGARADEEKAAALSRDRWWIRYGPEGSLPEKEGDG